MMAGYERARRGPGEGSCFAFNGFLQACSTVNQADDNSGRIGGLCSVEYNCLEKECICVGHIWFFLSKGNHNSS
jgi:hypothetical protein